MHRDIHKEMICVKTQYFNINRILLLAIGLWPYQQSKFVQLHIILFFGIFISFVIFQVRCLLEQLQQIYDDLKDENEIAIIKTYAYYASRYTSRLAVFSACCLFTVVIQPVWPHIFGIVLFTNNTQSYRAIQIVSEYFIDQEKYFYLIVLHTNLTYCAGTIVVLSTGTMLIAYVKHVCGMLKVASYRIEHAIDIDVSQNISPKSAVMSYKEIVYAVDIHRKALRFFNLLVSSFEGSFFFLIAVLVSCLSLNLFRIMFEKNIQELLVRLTFVNFILLYMFLANYAVQEITDHNSSIFFSVYNIRWYITPLYLQKLILLLLQKGNITLTVNIGGLFIPSLESFAALTSTSISYFTVLYSTRT